MSSDLFEAQDQFLWQLEADKEPFADLRKALPSTAEVSEWMKENDLDVCWLSLVTDNIHSKALFEFSFLDEERTVIEKLDAFDLRDREALCTKQIVGVRKGEQWTTTA